MDSGMKILTLTVTRRTCRRYGTFLKEKENLHCLNRSRQFPAKILEARRTPWNNWPSPGYLRRVFLTLECPPAPACVLRLCRLVESSGRGWLPRAAWGLRGSVWGFALSSVICRGGIVQFVLSWAPKFILLMGKAE